MKRYSNDPADAHGLALELEPADRVAVVEELLLVEPSVVEVLPPLRLLLAAVVVEQVREEPARLALLRAGKELVAHALALGLALQRLLARLALLRRQAPRQLAGAAASSSQRCSS